MTFAEKLKSIRKKAGLSQEQLAEKLGVSRQAVTKWETETGIPDIENMMAISALFDISIDELLSNERGMKKSNEYLFESVTEYDIDEPKRYDSADQHVSALPTLCETYSKPPARLLYLHQRFQSQGSL